MPEDPATPGADSFRPIDGGVPPAPPPPPPGVPSSFAPPPAAPPPPAGMPQGNYPPPPAAPPPPGWSAAPGPPPGAPFAAPMPPGPRTSGMAIASFIAGLFGVFTCVIVLVPLAALVLGVLALRQIDEQPQRIQGRGLAIGGIVLGGIGLVIGVMFIVLIALGDSTSTSSDGFFDEFGSARADYFAVGTCTQNPDGVDYADLEPTSCDRPHGGELYHRDDVDPSMDSYPGDDAMFEVAESMCLDEFQGYVGSTYQESRLGVYYFTPDRYTWAAGDREIVCLAFDPSADLPAGSVQGTGI